jgi:arsenate reductase-like glutaredoxin family protein
MQAHEEAQSLREHPLPPEIPTEKDLTLPSRILAIDEEIARISAQQEETLQKLREDRKKLFNRALLFSIMEDAGAKIVRHFIQPQQKVNLALIRGEFEEDYKRLQENAIAALKRGYEKSLKDVEEGRWQPTQADLKAIVKDEKAFKSLLHRPGEGKVDYTVEKKG